MLFKMIALERAAEFSRSKIRQIFVTQSRVLAGRVEQYFKKIAQTSQSTNTASGASKSNLGVSRPPEELLDFDDEVEDDERLPSKWSELQDHHFPLFVTFDQVSICARLEYNDIYSRC